MSKKRENPEVSAEAGLSQIKGADAKKAKIEGENETASSEAASKQVEGNSPVNEPPRFNRLPQELVAQVTTHLEYDDVWNLMESSKRNYKIVKAYGLEKINLARLFVDSPHIHKTYSGKYVKQDGSKVNYHLKDPTILEAAPSVVFKKILENCSSIDRLTFWVVHVSFELFDILIQCQTKFGTFEATAGSFVKDPYRFAAFLEKFEHAQVYVQVDHMWYDYVMEKLLPGTIIETLYGDGGLTNTTLEYLMSGDEVPKIYKVPLGSYITVDGIASLLQKLIDRRVERVDWNIGVLRTQRDMDVRRHIRRGKFINVFDFKVEEVREGFIEYTLTHGGLNIVFDVPMY